MTGNRILIVDDSLDAAEAVAMLLDSEGHEVRTAPTAHAAMREVQAWHPEVVLIDLGLPDMDGHELAQALGALPLDPRPVLIALSGYGSPEDLARSRAAGMRDHLVKPTEPDRLFAAVDEAVHG